VTFFVVAVAGCSVQPELVEAVAQSQGVTTASEQTGRETPKPSEADGEQSPALTGERRPLYRLQNSDVVEIEFPFSPELDETVAISPDGFVSLRDTQPVYAKGATVTELEEIVRHAYSGILHEPEVTVLLREFDKPYFIAAGEVVRPGKYELRSDTTVTEAVAIAGGFTRGAKHSQVILFRRSSDDLMETHLLDVKSMLRQKDLREDIHVRPGDMLFAPQNLISKIKPYMPVSGLSLYLNPTQF
jgi:polysaccharide export outer membrane protein